MLCLDCNCQDHSTFWLYAKQRLEVNKGHENHKKDQNLNLTKFKTNIPPSNLLS